ncbi:MULTISPECIES: flavin reductase family protein [unclassified Roseivivax]|uniref:flavin reductase family protein n=1 Tax=Roseivivax sp. GX 12232 TaxID=2900547 RepID=UPI001E34B01E|nr:flavin reductase family protein [Roseivivax sp. GX 12232]MCE0505080.1 flavin reductase family protein [Roseivivax sp. GX 12232]
MSTMDEIFEPGPGRERDFRDALGRFATGVTIVTTQTEDGPIAITANSFASLSLDPPLVLWSPAKASSRFKPFAEAQHFAIHVIATDQAALCGEVAKDARRFRPGDLTENENGVPLIESALAHFECAREAVHDGGDHVIVVGRVQRVRMREGEPLLFLQGRYGAFQAFD